MSVIDFRGGPKPSPGPPSLQPEEEDISLAFLGAIVESSDDAIVGTTLNGDIISWNASATRIYGYQPDEVIGRPATILIPEELRDEEFAILGKVRRGERVEHFETTRIAKDGRRFPISLTVSPVCDASGAVIAASKIARDIEAQKSSERACAQLSAIVESSDDAIASKTLDGIVQSWNAGAERTFGYAADEIIGRPITTIIPPELHEEERTILRKIRAGERIEHFDTVRVGKDGRRIPISLTVSPIRDTNGNVIGASKIARDISDRRKIERDLQASNRKLSAESAALGRLSEASARLWKADNLADGLDVILRTVRALTGADMGNVQLVNAGRDALSIVASEGFGPDFLATFETVSTGDRQAACGRALAAGQTVLIEDVMTDKAYAPYREVAQAAGYRAVISVPLFAADASPLGVVSVHFPSPHLPTEPELRRLHLYCRQASDFIQRTRLEQSLRHRETALEEADRRKDAFLAMLAHELRNPLTPIRYALAAVRSPEISVEQRARAEDMLERQVVHMSRLLDDLLDISRITRGALKLQKSPISLASVIEASVEAALPFIEARRHSLAVTLPDHDVWLVADPVRLAQVFSNLLINAAKYTAECGTIEIEATIDDGLAVAVRDNGVGIAPEMLPRLFTLFSQAESAKGKSEDGLGVGLAMVRSLVDLHRGSVEARSAGPGLGSEFIVRLPVESVPPDQEETAAIGRTAPTHPLRILVVDDNRDAADSCATLLGLAGHSVQKAYDGTVALQLGESFRPDIVLLDIGLPDINGYEVARRIRAAPWGAGLSLVALTGWGMEEDRQRALEAGFDRHFTKPVAPATLAELLNAHATAGPGDGG